MRMYVAEQHRGGPRTARRMRDSRRATEAPLAPLSNDDKSDIVARAIEALKAEIAHVRLCGGTLGALPGGRPANLGLEALEARA